MCCLCPMRGGALKRTSDSQWVHVLCALLLGARFRDPVNKEPINVLAVNRSALQTGCSYCKQSSGAFLKCHDGQCDALFHPTCGLSTGAWFAVSKSENHAIEVCIGYEFIISARLTVIERTFELLETSII